MGVTTGKPIGICRAGVGRVVSDRVGECSDSPLTEGLVLSITIFPFVGL